MIVKLHKPDFLEVNKAKGIDKPYLTREIEVKEITQEIYMDEGFYNEHHRRLKSRYKHFNGNEYFFTNYD
jgi:hypothetical protein